MMRTMSKNKTITKRRKIMEKKRLLKRKLKLNKKSLRASKLREMVPKGEETILTRLKETMMNRNLHNKKERLNKII